MFNQPTSVGSRYLLLLETKAQFITDDGTEEFDILSGQIELTIENIEIDQMSLSVRDLNLVGQGIPFTLREAQSGAITVQSRQGKGSFVFDQEVWKLSAEFPASFYYDQIGREVGYEQFEGHLFLAPMESFSGTLNGIVKPVEDKAAPYALILSEGLLTLIFEDGKLGRIPSVLLPLENIPLYDADNLPAEKRDSGFLALMAPACPPGTTVKQRKLRIQPVGFRFGAADDPTGPAGVGAFDALANQFITAAATIWGKACIQLEIAPLQMITGNVTVRDDSGNFVPFAPKNSPHHELIVKIPVPSGVTTPTTIIYFVDDPLSGVGRGCCYDAGTSSPKIVVSNQAISPANVNLLAHELGHALGACHPGGAGTSCLSSVTDLFQPNAATLWKPDNYTVMVSATPNSDLNTHFNFTNAVLSPALLPFPPGGLAGIPDCCPTYDTPDHYIRDFPEHAGEDVPILPAGRNFYSTSNVWNRIANDPNGGIAAGIPPNTPPPHEQPYRFDPDGVTPHTNYLFAKIEVRQNLPSHDVKVMFYLYFPGAGGGAGSFTQIGEATTTTQPTPGAPVIISYPWTVPTAAPNHSCIFAVVRSASEPAEPISAGVVIGDVSTRVTTDNDWVQRNLDIENIMPLMARRMMMSAPIMIMLPPELRDQETVRLSINTRSAEGLVGIRLHLLDGSEAFELKLSENNMFELPISSQPLSLAVQIHLPDDLSFGERFSIEINPTIGETDIVGYGYEFQVGEPHLFIRQALDIGLGAFTDLARRTGLESADALASLHRTLYQENYNSPERLAKQLIEKTDLFKAFEYDANQYFNAIMPNHCLAEQIQQFVASLGEDDLVYILLMYKDFVARLQMMIYTIYHLGLH